MRPRGHNTVAATAPVSTRLQKSHDMCTHVCNQRTDINTAAEINMAADINTNSVLHIWDTTQHANNTYVHDNHTKPHTTTSHHATIR